MCVYSVCVFVDIPSQFSCKCRCRFLLHSLNSKTHTYKHTHTPKEYMQLDFQSNQFLLSAAYGTYYLHGLKLKTHTHTPEEYMQRVTSSTYTHTYTHMHTHTPEEYMQRVTSSTYTHTHTHTHAHTHLRSICSE